MQNKRVVITGVGLTAPNGNNLKEFRSALLEGKSGLAFHNIRYMGEQVAGFCDFDNLKYQNRKSLRRGTRAGSIAIYCANEALADAAFEMDRIDRSVVGVYLGITEHGNVETEEEIYQLHQNKMDTMLWSPHHNPRTVANSPAGEVTLNLKITGPHCTLGAACAGGNLGVIHAYQMIQLGDVEYALAGGVSESPNTFGIFAGFAAQGALGHAEDPTQAIKPLDINRKGTVISEGGAVFFLETLESALQRNAYIYAEICGYAMNSDASDYVNPNTEMQIACMKKAMAKANLETYQIDLISMHATGTGAGDFSEGHAIKKLFDESPSTFVNFTKGHIGHAMGAAGALELAGNLPSFEDGIIHPGINCHEVDTECAPINLVRETPKKDCQVETILNNSFGMLGINSSLIVKKYKGEEKC
ncbi:MAG: beta-ketoacyl-[acyl-carrier-protein] synthase family protein [Halobacteriovoraceae bacterium]|nr:beta-ketoacyl-[acyl-carrier-protein] synthase family protein [Halobacteriovoraceae bacterium]MCB9093551.1 beta-ketoacyl-[acyl-carrier-protein] synthase family protein [Halobacteriovoraceae bacterium]